MNNCHDKSDRGMSYILQHIYECCLFCKSCYFPVHFDGCHVHQISAIIRDDRISLSKSSPMIESDIRLNDFYDFQS